MTITSKSTSCFYQKLYFLTQILYNIDSYVVLSLIHLVLQKRVFQLDGNCKAEFKASKSFRRYFDNHIGA